MRLSPEQQEQSGLQQDIYLHGRYLVSNWLNSLNEHATTERFYTEYQSRITEEYTDYLRERLASLQLKCSIMTEAVHATIDNAHTKILDTHQRDMDDNEI